MIPFVFWGLIFLIFFLQGDEGCVLFVFGCFFFIVFQTGNKKVRCWVRELQFLTLFLSRLRVKH